MLFDTISQRFKNEISDEAKYNCHNGTKYT